MIVILAWLACGCVGHKDQGHGGDAEAEGQSVAAFCRAIDYADTASMHDQKEMAAIMAGIVNTMQKSDSTDIADGLNVFLTGLQGDPESMRSAMKYASLYLGNPASPSRDDRLYLLFLKSLLKIRDIPEDIGENARERMRKTLLNCRGAIANDFRYIDRDGREGTLHAQKAAQTLLVFYDPECPHCPEILKRIATDPKVNRGIHAGALKVIAVYAEGKRDVWEKSKNDLPASWTVAYDLTGILDSELYDIPAMPTVYLLDSDCRVLIKDMPW